MNEDLEAKPAKPVKMEKIERVKKRALKLTVMSPKSTEYNRHIFKCLENLIELIDTFFYKLLLWNIARMYLQM